MTSRARSSRWAALALLVPLIAAQALAGGPADDLLPLVPTDAAFTLVVEDLAGHARSFGSSPLAGSFRDSKAIQAWLKSTDGRQLGRSLDDIEAALGADLGTIRDELLGRAVVLSLHLPADGAPDGARGLLMTRVHDRDLVLRLIDASNDAEEGSGALAGVDRREHAEIGYSIRTFHDGRPDEAYALLDDDTFVWTNAERLLLAVLDRRDDNDAAPSPVRARLDAELPDRPIARLYVDPASLGRLIAADPDGPRREDLPAAVAETLDAIVGIGLALEWREGPVLHAVELLDSDRLPRPIRSWAAHREVDGAPLGLIPASALAVAAGHVDFVALYDLIDASIPTADRDRFEDLTIGLRGVLLDRDLRSSILPAVGPGVVGWVDAPAAGAPLRSAPAVLAVAVGDEPALAALDNALRTVLAFVALDRSSKGGALRLTFGTLDGARVTALAPDADLTTARFAYAVGRGLLVIGTDASAVASALADPSSDPDAPRPAALAARDRLFPDATTFAHLDLDALRRLLSSRPGALSALARPDATDAPSAEETAVLLDLSAPFRGLYLTSTLAPDGTVAHQRLGLIVADDGADSR